MPKRHQTNTRMIVIHETIDTKTHSVTNVEVANVMVFQNGTPLVESIKLVQKILRNVGES